VTEGEFGKEVEPSPVQDLVQLEQLNWLLQHKHRNLTHLNTSVVLLGQLSSEDFCCSYALQGVE
jgi:hypothetical protein